MGSCIECIIQPWNRFSGLYSRNFDIFSNISKRRRNTPSQCILTFRVFIKRRLDTAIFFIIGICLAGSSVFLYRRLGSSIWGGLLIFIQSMILGYSNFNIRITAIFTLFCGFAGSNFSNALLDQYQGHSQTLWRIYASMPRISSWKHCYIRSTWRRIFIGTSPSPTCLWYRSTIHNFSSSSCR